MPDPKKQRAGRKGGQAVSRDRAHMAAIGRKGGQRSRVKRASQKPESAEPAVAGSATQHEPSGDGGAEVSPSAAVQEPRETMDTAETPVKRERATDLLKADHERVHSLFEDYETAGGEDKHNLADKIMRELDVHALIEEEIFYPAFQARADKEGRDLVTEALDEHRSVKEALGELRDMDPEDQAFESKFHDMMQDVQHHVGEEEGQMFPLAEDVLGDRLNELGIELQKRKQELLESMTSNPVR